MSTHSRLSVLLVIETRRENKGGIVLTVITGATVIRPGNMTTRRAKVNGSKKLKRCIMKVGIINKFRSNGRKVGINGR